MAPALSSAHSLFARYYCNDYNGYNGYNNNCNSAWYNYGRWILTAAIIVGAFLIFLLFACITARRRRKQGLRPMRGTGWTAYNVQPPPQYSANNNNYPAQGGAGGYPPAQYPNNQGYYGGGANQSYFGGQQQQGVELQQPGQTYQRDGVAGDHVYAPPAGPPPGKV